MKIGILGSGQLSRMLALAGYPLGLQFSCYGPEEKPCAADLMLHHRGEWDDTSALWAFAADCDIITFETENIPKATAQFLQERGKFLAPDGEALAVSQDRLLEKDFFRKLGIPTAAYHAVSSQQDLENIFARLPSRAILKTRRNGYDGKNQYRLHARDQIAAAWKHVEGQESILEEHIDFDSEASLIAVRDRQGSIQFYPLTQNLHRKGILARSHLLAPAQASSLQPQAEVCAKAILEKLNYVGVLTIEFFLKGDKLIANEMAPRVHNSGHWTIDAAITSQFENHLRAIAGLALGNTSPTQDFVMFNLLGTMPILTDLAAIDSLCIHDYSKSPAAGRKLGHLTLLQPSPERIRQVEILLSE